MMAHHAFNRPDHEVYFKDRTVELCHELLTSQMGVEPGRITYKEEEWEGGGNLGPSLSVGVMGLELATLVFMEYVRQGDRLAPMPLTVVDTGYGLERFTWVSQGTKTAYEAAFASSYDELRVTFPPRESALLIDHARAVNFLLTDGVVPSNSKDGYFARLLLRRMARLVAKGRESPTIEAILDRTARDLSKDYPEIGEHRDDIHRVVAAELERYEEAVVRARDQVRRAEERADRDGQSITEADLIEWYDSLGLPPDLAVEDLKHPIPIPEDFYARVAARHEAEARETDYVGSLQGASRAPHPASSDGGPLLPRSRTPSRSRPTSCGPRDRTWSWTGPTSTRRAAARSPTRAGWGRSRWSRWSGKGGGSSIRSTDPPRSTAGSGSGARWTGPAEPS